MDENEVKKEEVNKDTANNKNSLGGGSIIFGMIFGGLIGLFFVWVLCNAVLFWLFDTTPTWLYVVGAIIGGLVMVANLSDSKKAQIEKEEQSAREKEQLELLRKLNEKK